MCKANFGLPPEADLSYQTLFEVIHPDDRTRVREAVAESLKNNTEYDAEYRNIWPDGSTHWIIARGRGVSDPDGEVLRMVGVTLDITERKQSEEVRTELLRRLVTAQEEERRRIARELHDQMGQHLTAMMLSLRSLKDSHLQWNDKAQEHFQPLHQIGDQLVQQVHHLAWELRPSALDDLGLLSALANYVEEWGERFRITADFHSIGFDRQRLPPQIETTLYRIVQESLTNVIKHAQANRISVILELKRDHVFTLIEDNGVGFDNEALMDALIKQRATLGLLGMRERASLVGGTLNIESAPGEGTTVYVRIPVLREENGAVTHEKASHPHSR
jgi:PAS domain S-box-containing protein